MQRRLALVALGLGALAIGFVTLAAGASDPWETAAAQVKFPLYQPKVTLGFKLAGVDLQTACFAGSVSVNAAYESGTGKQSPTFGLTEAYPRFCGDPGESMTVTSIDVNGVKVPVNVYCSSAGPKCTVEDGFNNGFLLYLTGPGPMRTRIAAWSQRVSLDDLAEVVRSLARVPKPRATPIAKATGRCSKTEAISVVKRLHLGSADELKVPVAQVLCGAFLGPGSNAMVASLAIPSCGRTAGWVVFRWTGTAWKPVLTRNNGADLKAVGSDIRETQFVLLPTDAHCFPTGGTRSRTWHWNGNRFTASPWKAKPANGAAPAPAAKSGYFKTPSGNIVCGYGGKDPAYVGCRIKSGLKPLPRPRGPDCFSRNEVFLHATGPTTTGRTICPGEDEGDAGVFAFEDVARVLGYGKTWSGGGIQCTSAEAGLTCRNKSDNGFFLSRERWRAF